MKKAISLLVILCIAASLFALGSIRVGGAYSLVTGRTKPYTQGDQDTVVRYSSSGFGFNVLGKDDISDNLATWFDFNMVFGTDGKFKTPGSDWTSLNDMYTLAEKEARLAGGSAGKKLYSLSSSGGVVYKLPFTNTHFNYSVGGGLFIDRLYAEISQKYPNGHTEAFVVRSFNLGITSYGEISKQYSEHFGISLTVMLRMGFLNFSTQDNRVDNARNEERAFGFAPSFSMPVVLGLTYYF